MDKYVKIKKIGEGSFGKALLVRSKANGKQMVVKEINMNKMSRKEREEARKEVAVLAQLCHPNIVSYKESFEEIGNLYIVMDYCDGGDLYSRINMQRGVLFPEDQVLDWFVQTCLAIKHIHDRKILHRDIKSQNIFLTKHGIVKLGDFGIAKVLNSTVELARTCIGTPYYLSPEICENKPYNNKSDIWSLGCVLYELTTLKHAFEAGNMKNLVLKIIRGSYPPPPPRYSYDLRSLIAQLFKRSPRDRPSINTILKKPLLQLRIRKFLSENEVQDEFSHTVMHGVKIKKQIPPGGARPLPPKPHIANKAPSPSPRPKYDPVSVYAPSVARRSVGKENRKSSEVRKSNGNNVKKPTPIVGNNVLDLNKRRQELIEKEKKRREEAKKKELLAQQQVYAKRHQEFVEKQKAARMLKAREEGWKGFIDSLSSDDSDKTPVTPKKDDVPKAEVKPATPKPAVKDRGVYEQYHAYLDNLDQHRLKPVSPAVGVAGALDFGVPPAVAQAAKQGVAAGVKGAEAAERAKIIGEFRQRKLEAELNKARAHGDLFGGAAAAISPKFNAVKQPVPVPKPSAGRPTSAQDSRQSHNNASPLNKASPANKNEQDYLAKLKQIRLQNLNERRNLKERMAGGKADPKYKPPVGDQKNADIRKKKIEALKAQADERAKKLREELEKKRKEAYNLEQHRLKQQANGAVPMTEAMKAIGIIKEDNKPQKSQLEKCPVGLTAAMEAIGAVQPAETDDSKSLVQKQKEAILKRLNKKPPIAEKIDRPKWGEPVKHVAVDRSKWEAGDAADLLRRRSLEETGSHMEATSTGDVVIKHDDLKSTDQKSMPQEVSVTASTRKQWAGRANTVLNVLEKANITEAASTTTIQDVDQESTPIEEQSAGPPTDSKETAEIPSSKAPAIGTTITIARSPNKGTLVIKRVEPLSEDAENDKTSQDVKTEEYSQDARTENSSLKVTTVDKQRSRSASPDKNEDGKSALFEHLALDEEKGSKEGEGMVVEDLDVKCADLPSDEKEDDKVSSNKEAETSFNKGDIETENTESQEEKLPVFSRSVKDVGVVIGLTTGHFDTDSKLLRTCSEPDLSKLFRTNLAENPFFEEMLALNRSCTDESTGNDDLIEECPNEVEVEQIKDDNSDDDNDTKIDDEKEESFDEHLKPDLNNADEEETAKGSTEKEDDEELDEETMVDSEEEDLETMRESMLNLLQSSDPPEEDDRIGVKQRRKVKKTTKKGRKTKKIKSKISSERLTSSLSSDSFVEDFRSMRETMKTLLQPTSEKQDIELKSVKDESSDHSKDKKSESHEFSNLMDVKESWQSDEEDDDDYFEEEDMFSRLEATRAKLEQELGCESFLKAYRTVQAIHEDEDENMEEGMKLVSSILGHDKMHLYPAILQLVMADGVFTEDND